MAAMQAAEAKAKVERAGTLTAGEMAKAKDAIEAKEIDINTDEGETIPTSYDQPEAVLLEQYEESVRTKSFWEVVHFGSFFKTKKSAETGEMVEADLLPKSARYYAAGRRVMVGEGGMTETPPGCGRCKMPAKATTSQQMVEFVCMSAECMGFHSDRVTSCPLQCTWTSSRSSRRRCGSTSSATASSATNGPICGTWTLATTRAR